MDLRVNGITFNVAQEPPTQDIGSELLKCMGTPPDVFIVALQEVDIGLQIGALLFWDQWTQKISEKLSELNYYRIESLRMQGIVLSVFALKCHLPSIRDVRCDWIGTGHANFWGNKGAVTIRFRLYGKTIAFINTHLPHGVESAQFEKRIASVNSVFKNVTFDGEMKLLEHDVLLLLGDLNFRIREIKREEVIRKVADGTMLECLHCDELKLLLQSHPILQNFAEAELSFAPTYKYDKNSPDYDSSSKLRKPAWTDRILFRKVEDGSLEARKYFAHQSLTLSDHRPVFGLFNLKLQKNDEESAALVDIKANFDQTKCDDVTVEISIQSDHFLESQDWIGLYRLKFIDYRDWVTFQWCTFGHVQPSEKESSVTRMRVSVPDIGVKGTYIVGYYSRRHRNLIGLSNSFQIPDRKYVDFWD